MTTGDSKKPDEPNESATGEAAEKAVDKVGKGTDGAAGNAAGKAVEKSVSGDGPGKGRQTAGRYTGAATSGAVGGAQKGSAPGAAVGAAKNVAAEGVKDAGKGAKKAAGGSPAAQPAGKRMAKGAGQKSAGPAASSGQKGPVSQKQPAPTSTGGERSSKKLPTSGGGAGDKAGKAAGAAGAAGAADTAGKAGDAADKVGKAAEGAEAAGKAAGALEKANKGFDGAKANLAGGATKKAIEGDGSSKGRQNVGRYAGAAVAGGVSGAEKGAAVGGVGALPGAAIGAAKNVAVEGGKDAVKGLGKASPTAEPADKRLGAGGTSKNDEGMGTKVAKGAALGGGAAAAPPVTGLMMLMKLLKMLQLLMLQLATLAINAAMGVWGLIGAAFAWLGKTIAAPFVFMGGIIAKGAGAVLGITVGATVAPAAAVTSGVVAGISAVAMVGTLFAGVINSAAYTGGTADSGSQICTVSGGGGSGETGPVDANAEEQARLVYSVLKDWGMPDENIAGILGNWDAESGIDPASVQNFPVRTYTMTAEKKSAAQNTNNGIGLGQWTFDRNSMLRDYASDKGMDWWTLEAQLAFMAEGDNASDRDIFLGMVETSQGTPGEAALYFHDKWERSADTAEMAERRASKAEMWYGKMSGWEVDDSIAGKINDIIGGLLDGIEGGVNTVLGNCEEEEGGGSATLTEGGMSLEDAEALMELYNKEGDEVLQSKFNGGGPGKCNGSYIENCVSFSWYFVTKYTSYTGGYAPGNGKDVAASMASAMGKKTSDTPTPYSVFSHANSSAAGHTGIVLGVEGDRILIGEAAYCAWPGRARWVEASEWKNAGWTFTDVSDILKDGDEVKV
ncbi:phage tail tip lysozyme [Brevibacterium oceani]|uniref:phage tail tip lysozyme n=1 Tax=Brevibacterium oceani TaxID=358099 RepID=UPI0015E728A9|nr:phage tail tip lysozyme [Brevibacterium oceani]